MSLTENSCVPCKIGSSPLTTDEITAYLAEVADWSLSESPPSIARGFKFDDFKQALAFVDQVGALAEDEGHHPDISFGWGHATVSLYTHDIGGLHQNDFIMAAKIDRLEVMDA